MHKPCIEWVRAKSRGGYGQVRIRGNGVPRTVYVHRLVCEFFHGSPLPGQEVLHSCDNRSCYEPSHLRWGTRAENVRDAVERGRQAHGPQHWRAVLSTDDVETIRLRLAKGEKRLVVAGEFGVSAQYLTKIRSFRCRRVA